MNPHDQLWQACNEFRSGHPAAIVSNAVDEFIGTVGLLGAVLFLILAMGCLS